VQGRGGGDTEASAAASAMVLQLGSLASSPVQLQIRPVKEEATRKEIDQRSKGVQRRYVQQVKRSCKKRNSDSEHLKVID
jgi:hypothetical protein